MEIEKLLEKIGFGEKEAKIYLVGIGMTIPTALSLSKKTGINRTTVYDIITSLKEKGLVNNALKKNNNYFEFLPPEEIIHYLDRDKREFLINIEKKKRIMDRYMTELKSFENLYKTKTKVKFFEGEKAMREAYEDTLVEKNSNIRAYANVETMHKTLPDFFPEYYQRRKGANVSMRVIMPDNKMSEHRMSKDNIELRESILIDKEKFNFAPEVDLYDDKILISSWEEKLSVLIESRDIAELFKKMPPQEVLLGCLI